MDEITFKALLDKYQNGTCTPEETALLESWYTTRASQDRLPPPGQQELSQYQQLIWQDITEKTGVNAPQPIIFDREKIGRPVLVVTHVQLEKQTTPLLNEFEQWVQTMAEVECCLHVSGEWNFILHITATSPQAYFQFLMEKINSLPNVAHTDSCFVMKECKRGGPLLR